jgi:hypothetical protein
MSISQKILVGLLVPVVTLAGAAASADAAQGKKGKQPAIATPWTTAPWTRHGWRGPSFRKTTAKRSTTVGEAGFTLDGRAVLRSG